VLWQSGAVSHGSALRLSLALLLGCSDPASDPDAGLDAATADAATDDAARDAGPVTPVIAMDFGSDAFFDSPFPSESRREGGVVDVDDFPNRSRRDIVTALVDLLRGAPGFGTTSAIYFRANVALEDVESGPLETRLPDAPIQLLAFDTEDPPHPTQIRFHEDGGPFGAPNLLSILPYQGLPLAPDTRYAAVVRTSVATRAGTLTVSPAVTSLRDGGTPEGMSEDAAADYRDALDALDARGIDDVAALAVFRTWDPVADLVAWRETAISEIPEVTAVEARETFDDFCVYEGRVEMPVFQQGEPPFTDGGGEVRFEEGAPVPQGTETARVVVTVPRGTMPDDGYPFVVFSRTGGGGDRPLVDRGVRDAEGVPLEEGSGPARELAQVGWGAISIDGPHGGIRNITGGDEQLLIFNVANPPAMRDNVRQSAIELVLAAHLGPTLSLEGCEGAAETARFDGETTALMGHSMGGTISPLAMAVEPRFDALLLSGFGGSWVENVVHKELPVPVKPFASLLLGLPSSYDLHTHDPALALLQWAGEPADPPVYASYITGESPRHVLMMQGIVDRYILPPIANSGSLSLELSLGGPILDAEHPEVMGVHTPLQALLPLTAGETVTLPASGNLRGATAIVTQHAEDGVEDGHEVVFQTDRPKAQYRCFLETLARDGVPTVPSDEGCP